MAISVSNSTAASPTPQAKRDAYLQHLLSMAQAGVPEALKLERLRGPAAAIAQEHGFPSTRQEDWRFTDLSPMLAVPFQTSAAAPSLDLGALGTVQLPEVSSRLVMVNGQFSPTLSNLGEVPTGVVVGNLASLSEDLRTRVLERLGQAPGSPDVFSALNTTGFQDAAVVWVDRNVAVSTPIQVVALSVTQAGPTVTHPRCLVVAEAGSAVTVVEDFWSQIPGDHFNNSVTEIWADDNAEVTHVRLQREGAGTFHIGKTAVTQGRDSRYRCTPISLGARISRHNLVVTQTGPQTETTLNGLSAIADTQLADTHSVISLHHPHGNADQRHKCIVDGRAHAVFNGRVWVPRAAQQTNASQLNRNLLLSDKARVDTKPELDIVADNVKCAHGATVSQLDANEVFYLQSRGISADQAQRLLIYGFAMEMIETIPLASLREQLIATVTQRTA
jgi:Fe-S cluster assembly protein SufD